MEKQTNNGYLTRRVTSIAPSLTLAITAKANKLKADGVSIVGFGAGEPDFNTPDYIIEAAKYALDQGYTKYTPASGRLDLKKAICQKLEKENDLLYAPNQIIVSNGAKHSLFNTMLALVEEGDEVIIPAPYWLTYPELVKVAGGVPVYVETTEENAFKLTPEQLEGAITERTKALILNSPSNPTGSVYTRDELFALSEVLEKHDVWVISDEIYEKLNYTGTPHVSIASLSERMYNRTVVINGHSKCFSMTGWRIGYAAAPKPLADAMNALQSHATSNPNSIAQYAAMVALTDPRGKEFEKEMYAEFDARRKLMVETIAGIPGISCVEPSGAFYVLVNVGALYGKRYRGTRIGNALELADKLIDVGVAVIPGTAFGAPDHIRLSYAVSRRDIVEGLTRIRRFVEALS